MPRALRYALKGIGIILFVVILSRIDATKAMAALGGVSPVAVGAALGLFPLIYFIKSSRWHVLTVGSGAKSTFHESTSLYLAAMFLGVVTPGRVGEAFKIPGLVRQGLRWKDAMLLTIIDRALDMVVLGAAAIVATAMLFTLHTAALLAAVSGATVIVLAILAWRLPRLRGAVLPNLKAKTWGWALLLTVLNWCVYFLQLVVLEHAFSLGVPLLPFLAIMMMVTIISALPIAPAGLGTRDAALLFFFGQLGIAEHVTVAFSFTIFVLTILSSLIGLYYWMRHPMHS